MTLPKDMQPDGGELAFVVSSGSLLFTAASLPLWAYKQDRFSWALEEIEWCFAE